MSNGKGNRWGDHQGIPKQLIEIGGETLLQRIVRQFRSVDPDAEIIISSSDPRHETEGARRYSPLVNEIELDRFVDELLIDDTCFLYGDTYYEDNAVKIIASSDDQALSFYGDERSIAGISCRNAAIMRSHISQVRRAFLSGRITTCIGWQVYQSYFDQLFEPLVVGEGLISVAGEIAGFNSPDDLRDFIDGKARMTQFVLAQAKQEFSIGEFALR